MSLLTGAKSFADNPIIGNSYLNKMGLHVCRVQLANQLSRFRRFFLKRQLSEVKQNEYLLNGYTLDTNFLGNDEFQLIKQEVFDSVWPLREMRQGGTATRRVFLDESELVSKFPKLASFITNPELLARLRFVAGVGGEPIFSIQAIFSEANTKNDPQMIVHSDTFHSNAKAWFFLEDVGEDDGPLAYVQGSHRLSHKRISWEKKQSLIAKKHPIIYHSRGSFRATDLDLEEMELYHLRKMVVPGNTLVVADTFGFHRRSTSSHNSCRVEIYATLRRNPFLPWVGLDFFSIPYFKRRSGTLSLFLLTQLSKIGVRKMPWKLIGFGKIKDIF